MIDLTGRAAFLAPGAERDLVSTPPSAECEVSVVVPVRDEEKSLEATLRALNAQIDLAGQPMERDRYEIIVLANNCRDQTCDVALSFALDHPQLHLYVAECHLQPEQAHIGAARRLLMDEAARRLLGNHRPLGIIASTDGDTEVAPNWIAATLREFEGGVDAVAGRIIVAQSETSTLSPSLRRYHLRDVAYRHLIAELESLLDPDPADPWPRHHQHFGASFAVTAEAYCRAGGLPPVPLLEDVAFYDLLRRHDMRIRHSPAVRVVTSPRQSGRVAMGLSTQLDEWEQLAHAMLPVLVEPVSQTEASIRMRHCVRGIWRRARVQHQEANAEIWQSALDIGIDPRWLEQAVSDVGSFGTLLEAIQHHMRETRPAAAPAAEMPVPITEAIHDLRSRLSQLRTRPAEIRPDAAPAHRAGTSLRAGQRCAEAPDD